MAIQDTPRVAGMANLDVASSAPATLAAKPARRLPVQKDWPTWAIVATQVGILVGIIAFWEIGRDDRADQTHSSGRSRPPSTRR